jgi:hypothetical protein
MELVSCRSLNVKSLFFSAYFKNGLQYGVSDGLQYGVSDGLQYGVSDGLQYGVSDGLQYGVSDGLQVLETFAKWRG